MQTIIRLTILLSITTFTSLVSAQAARPEQIPPEGFVDSSGRLVLPLRKALANRRLMVRDMGRAFATCPNTHTTLSQIRDEMFSTEAKNLQAQGYSPKDYAAFWEESFTEGKSEPVASQECESEFSTWKKMLKNIREQ
jgi:hypothetical protein